MTEHRDEDRSVLARVRILEPRPGGAYALQRHDGGVDQVQVAGAGHLDFTTSIILKTVGPDDTIELVGEHVKGPQENPFLCIAGGTVSGQSGPCWTHHAEVPIESLASALPMARNVMPPVLGAAILDIARDGGSTPARVELISPWMQVW